MASRDHADDFVHLVTWVLDRVLHDEYWEEFDAEGNIQSVELGKDVGPRHAPVDLEIVEHTLAKILSPEQFDALTALKENPTPQQTERVMNLLFPAEIAHKGILQLGNGEWADILLFIHGQFSEGADIGLNIGEVMIKEREGFSSPSGGQIEKHIQTRILSMFTPRKYLREFQGLFPRMVKRADSLRLLPARKKVPDYVRRYLIEASRCFIYGQFLGSLFLCRSAIEEGVEDRLRNSGCTNKLERVEKREWLYAILKLAHDERLLDDSTYRQADCIRRLAKDAIHGSNLPNEQDCSNAYKETRYVLYRLYE